MRRAVQAAHAAEQPGVRVLMAAKKKVLAETRMAAAKVGVETLHSLEPLSSLSDVRLKEAADLCNIASVGGDVPAGAPDAAGTSAGKTAPESRRRAGRRATRRRRLFLSYSMKYVVVAAAAGCMD